MNKAIKYISLVAILVLVGLANVPAQTIIKIDKLTGDVAIEMKSAFSKGKSDENFWIGYSIFRKANSQISVGSFTIDDDFQVNFRDLINNTQKYINFRNRSGKSSAHGRRSVTILNGQIISDDGTDHETAILFRYDRSSTALEDFSEIAVCNFSHYTDLKEYPLYWLGNAATKNSLNFLIDLYENKSNWFAKEELVAAIGLHSDQPEVTPLLNDIIQSDEKDELRENAVFWMGQQNNETAFNALKSVIKNDQSLELREHAVTSLAFMDFPKVVDELIDIARHSPEDELREHAVYGLGNKAVKKAEAALKDFIENDPDIEIKKRAVYALANNDVDNIPYLINLVKTHPSLTLRKTAIYSLSNSEDNRAVDALIELAGK